MLSWYDRHRRSLPWRAPPGRRPDPYAVWLSEIMLQQTTVAAVVPYFTAFLARWPNVARLAAAPLDEVMRQWAGLGYYSRARNLHACARTVAAAFDGRFPESEAALRGLPGIGPYTAAAIAAIAFGRHAVVVDGNVERVIARFFAIETPLPAAKAAIKQRAALLTPVDRPGDYAQAMMDLGATICTPRKPACAICPLTQCCAAGGSAAPELYPRKAPKPERPLRRGEACFIRRQDNKVLLRTRPPTGLLGGMTEFPGTDWRLVPAAEPMAEAGSTAADRLAETELAARLAPLSVAGRTLATEVEHVFTHFRLALRVRVGVAPLGAAAPADCRWVNESDLDREALPSLMRKVLEAVRRDAEGPFATQGRGSRRSRPRNSR